MAQATETIAATTGTDSLQNQVLKLAREIEHLAGSGLSPEDFFRQFLERLVVAVAAPAGAVWLLGQGRLSLCCELRLKETGLVDSTETQRFQQRLLGEVAANGQARVVHTDDEPQVVFPRRHLLILAALRSNGACRGVVEIVQRPDVAAGARAGYLQFVEQMSGFASLYLERSQVPAPAPATAGVDDELARFGLQLQRSLRLPEVAAVAANEGRLLVGCDRLSVVIQRGHKIMVTAVSGQESVHARANLVQAMIRLSREVIRSGVPVKYTGTTEAFAPQVKERLADFVQESGARMVFVLPLLAPPPLVAPDQSTPRRGQSDNVFGCLVLEQFTQSEPSRKLTERLDWLTTYAAAALHNSRTYQSVFLLPLWTALGRAADWLHGRKLVKTLLALSIIAAVVAVLTLVPIDFRVEGAGRLMPVVRRQIFVPYDGEVVEVMVASGERVSAGQLLVKLRNTELRSELIATESVREEKRKLMTALLADRDDAIKGPSGERGNRIEGELSRTVAELNGLERKLQALQERESRLMVTSPVAGVVSTFQVDQLLKYRPVRRGEIMMEVMDDSGPWQLELNVDEHRTGHLLRARETADAPLPIEYLLVTAPERSHQAVLKEVGTRVVISEENQPVIEVLASIDDVRPLSPRIGAEVRARIHCGRKSIGYVLFGDVIEFVQKYLWL